MLQGASPDLEEAFQDKDEAFECVTTLLDDTLEQADIALEAAKKALKHGDNASTSQVITLSHVACSSCIQHCMQAICMVQLLCSILQRHSTTS